MVQTKVVEKIKTHILGFITFFSENRTVYEIMWKNIVERDRKKDGNIIRRMRFACMKTKARDTHSEYVILIPFQRQQWLHKRASILRYTYIACLVTSLKKNVAILPLKE